MSMADILDEWHKEALQIQTYLNECIQQIPIDTETWVLAILILALSSVFLGAIYLDLVISPVLITANKDTIQIKHRLDKDGIQHSISLRDFIERFVPSLATSKKAVYLPTPYLFNGHLQTIYAALVAQPRKAGKSDDVKYERDIVEMPDGGVIALDWYPTCADSIPKETPILFVTHGLTGGSHETYVSELVSVFSSAPYYYRTVVCNFRGCAGSDVLTPQLYCAAYTDDVKHIVQTIQSRFPDAPMVATGFSLGANVLSKYVGETGEDCPFLSAVSVGNPLNLVIGSETLEGGWFSRNVYSYRMAIGKAFRDDTTTFVLTEVLVAGLVSLFRPHMHLFEDHPDIDLKAVLSSGSVREFDAQLTAKCFGFSSVDEYYRLGSSSTYVPKISIPCLFIHALDDPIVNPKAIPREEIIKNPCCLLVTTKSGGHLGWFEGTWRPKRWQTKPIAQYLNAIIQAHRSLPLSQRRKIPSPRVYGLAAAHILNDSLLDHVPALAEPFSTTKSSSPKQSNKVVEGILSKPTTNGAIVPKPKSVVAKTSSRFHPSLSQALLPKGPSLLMTLLRQLGVVAVVFALMGWIRRRSKWM
ncbi:hypothetical protein SmJEL517_g02432 [Synchytrium microbalum]|uniref:AB hydrolase-1 domain-containing protein n=1 Tax=Synchytrium microbalum TaxID=1806994 RepID=A0A507C6Z7_9FUNG|nr:uncharacterized protein SmJEL517_g02432 [Synchytrium microbalum]TPX35118.1 hypothetical protein SmJEL517_g02432 [Synchytrium microbalum]